MCVYYSIHIQYNVVGCRCERFIENVHLVEYEHMPAPPLALAAQGGAEDVLAKRRTY